MCRRRPRPTRRAVRPDGQQRSRLLEQMLRNLISNALKYTSAARCSWGAAVAGEICESKSGTPASASRRRRWGRSSKRDQVDNAARERSHGFGLGLSIVNSLGYCPAIRSACGRATEKGRYSHRSPAEAGRRTTAQNIHPPREDDASAPPRHTGAILIIEDDPDARGHLEVVLDRRGLEVSTTADGPAALESGPRYVRPDLILADYNLPSRDERGGERRLNFGKRSTVRFRPSS